MSDIDRYKNFEELAGHEREGADYGCFVEDRGSELAVIAPHGGGIEPGTSEIAKAIAGSEFSLYCFEGSKPNGNREVLHITGTHFDEPRCIQVVTRSKVVVAVHGCVGNHRTAYVGGLAENLKYDVIQSLRNVGFHALEDTSSHSGCDAQNICNRGISGMGLQLEITSGLRRAMFRGWSRSEREGTTPIFDKFVAAIRGVLLELKCEQ